MAGRLSAAIRCRTIAADDPRNTEVGEFRRLHQLLMDWYPALHEGLERDVVNGLSLLYRWEGSDPSLAPLLLLAHQDVVSAEDESGWLVPPFDGVVAEGAVWGRGAIDVKGGLIAICESVERLLEEGFKPRRGVYLAFGHDEEVGGLEGAASIGEVLMSRGVRPLFISDEGGAILHGVIPGVNRPVAAVGIAEKGYLTLSLKVTASGGHASMPPAQTAIGILSDAVQRIEASPFPARLSGATYEMVKCLAAEMSLPARMAISMLPLTSGLVRRKLEKTPSGAASLRTTTAVTMIESGIRDNILPQQATATLNCRTLPGETSESVISRIRDVVDDRRVRISIAGRFHSEPPPVADVNGPGYAFVKRAISRTAPDAVVAPCLVLGGTDSRHYTHLCPSVYRFGAMRLTPEDLVSIHGNNEKVDFENCRLLQRFYYELISEVASN
jgi:carboxypeptidase PM20D1